MDPDPDEDRSHRLRRLHRLHLGLLIARLVVLAPLVGFGLLVFFSAFGEGSPLVGALLILAGVAGPAGHGLAAWRTRAADPGGARVAHRVSLALLLVDGVVAGAFAVSSLRLGNIVYPAVFVLVVLLHGAMALLAARAASGAP